MNVLPQKFMIAIWLFLTTGVYSSEFQIQRNNSDVFTIPPSQCKEPNSDCRKYNALRGVTSCSCQCDAQNATFAFYENSWKCVGNDVVRRLLGCQKRMFFQNETPDQQLQVVNYNSDRPKYLSSTLTGTCTVNLAASRTMRCHENGLSLGGTISNEAFQIVWDARASTYKLQFDLPDEKPLQGPEIINLSIQCSGATADECLLFKMAGTTNCRPPLTTNAKTTISMIDGKSTEPSRLSSLSTSTEVTKVPGSESDRNSGAIISTSIVALIAGINGFLVLVILVIGLCIYHRQRSRSYPLTSVPSGTLESSLSSLETQNGQQNADYATLTASNCGNYASVYRVPNFVRNDAPRSVEQPVYNIIEELPVIPPKRSSNYGSSNGPQNNVPLSVEQRVYNLIEDLSATPKQGLHNHGTSETSIQKAPLSVEQRLNTLIEDLDTGTAQSPSDNGSSQRRETEGPISVEQREYTLVENLNIVNNAENPERPASEKPVCHVLEEPSTNAAGSSDEHQKPKV